MHDFAARLIMGLEGRDQASLGEGGFAAAAGASDEMQCLWAAGNDFADCLGDGIGSAAKGQPIFVGECAQTAIGV